LLQVAFGVCLEKKKPRMGEKKGEQQQQQQQAEKMGTAQFTSVN
jgi:hypothetical protein